MVLQFINATSVVDVGCGIGTWLSVWKQHGVKDLLGIDGSYIDPTQLVIESNYFLQADLEKELSLPRRFGLVTSLEVAEHLAPAAARSFICSLCKLGDVILFSAAIPNQGGTLHYNEQYPDYWIGLFREFGFSAYDCIREKIWDNPSVTACYRQNIMFYVNDQAARAYPSIVNERKKILPLVHPIHFQHKQDIIVSYQRILKTPFHAGWHFVKKYWSYISSKLGYGKKNGSRFDRY